MAAVKMEVEDALEEEHGPLHKRHKQQSLGMGGLPVPPSQYNPLDEPSPLGLRLRKSPSLLELIQMKLSQSNTPKVGSQGHGRKECSKAAAASGDKLKASNFPGSLLKIGTWEYKSRHEGDLVAKCYFAKHKLVWEVLDGGLKNKIEIQWSDIMALKANYQDDGPGTLNVVLARQPLFFRETNPQPRKHTLWQATSDFTGGQASIHRQHYLECPQGSLGKHFEKLIQCDPRLNFLSQQGEITLDSPYFEPRISVFDDQNEENKNLDLNTEGSPSFFSLQDTASPSGPQSSSSKNDLDGIGRHSGSYPRETPSPTSAMDTLTVEDIKNSKIDQLKELSNWDQIKVPGIRSSMSMSDLVSHLEHRISEQGTSNNPTLSSEEWQSLQILDDINRCLFSDIQHSPDSDEKSLMSRVNSLCCLLQKDGSNALFEGDLSQVQERENESNGKKVEGDCSMSRKDSVGDLLLNLPRIASLPQFLFNISEDFESQAR
ncbi:hypothetical protein DH2020_013470 [Rehmannia glutinosa]|uniref:TRF2/HOY1 PH-like domain-containing protein n=1 Tax=Rehmannia glutinosa TaxID=99300 RepID=A0ABR0X2K3_REHGL